MEWFIKKYSQVEVHQHLAKKYYFDFPFIITKFNTFDKIKITHTCTITYDI